MSARPWATSLADKPYCPTSGEIIRIDFSPQAGHEMKGPHPALVLSPRVYNKPAKLCVLCPITSKGKGYPFEVVIPFGLKTGGVVLADQVKSLSWEERAAQYVEKAPPELVDAVKTLVAQLLEIEPLPAGDDGEPD